MHSHESQLCTTADEKSMIDNNAVFPIVIFALQLPVLITSFIYFVGWMKEPKVHCLRLRSAGLVRRWLPTLLILVAFYGQFWTYEQLGMPTSGHWILSIALGLIAGCSFEQVVAPFVYSLFERSDSTNNSSKEHLGTQSPSNVFFNLTETVFVNPVFEEVIYRGVFVYYVGMYMGIAAGVTLGLVSCVWLHLYFGVNRIPVIVCFFAVNVLLLYSPLGLVGSIAFHIACNGVVCFHRMRFSRSE